VLEGADFKNRLPGADGFREIPFLALPIHMADLDRFSNHAFERMQDDKTRTVGEEVAQRHAIGRKYQHTISLGFDLRLVFKRLLRIAASRVIADGKTALSLFDLQVFNGRRIGAPVLVA
jgi:hypothetical protein